MKKYRIVWAFFLLIIFFFVKCHKKVSDIIIPANPNTNVFPNKPGDIFFYSVTVNDTLGGKVIDSFQVTVSIVGKTLLKKNGTPVTIWVYNYPNRTDTNYVGPINDSIIFYDQSQTVKINKFQFPLSIGSKWPIKLFDTCEITRIDKVFTPSGNYSNAYLVKENAYGPNYFLKKSQYISPEVGIVQINFIQYNFGFSIQNWKLKSFVLK